MEDLLGQLILALRDLTVSADVGNGVLAVLLREVGQGTQPLVTVRKQTGIRTGFSHHFEHYLYQVEIQGRVARNNLQRLFETGPCFCSAPSSNA